MLVHSEVLPRWLSSGRCVFWLWCQRYCLGLPFLFRQCIARDGSLLPLLRSSFFSGLVCGCVAVSAVTIVACSSLGSLLQCVKVGGFHALALTAWAYTHIGQCVPAHAFYRVVTMLWFQPAHGFDDFVKWFSQITWVTFLGD